MTFDPAGNLYTTNFSVSSLSKFDNAGNLIGPFSTVPFSQPLPATIVRDNSGNFYVGSAFTNKIVKLNSTGTVLTTYTVATGGGGPENITLASDQCTMYYTSFGPTIYRYNVCTGTQLANFITIPGPGVSLYNIRFLTDGSILVAGRPNIFVVNPSGTTVTPYPAPVAGLSLLTLNLNPDGISFWTSDYSSGVVYKYLIDPPALPVFSFNSSPFTTVAGLAIFGEPTVSQPLKQADRIMQPDMVMQLRVDQNLTAALSTDTTQSVVTYNLTVKNISQGKAADFLVNFPVDPLNEEVLSVDFPTNSDTNPQSWVTQVVSDNIKIQLGPFEAATSTPITRSAVIRVGIKSSATPGETLVTRASGAAGWAGGSAIQNKSNSVSFKLDATSSGDDSKGGIQQISAALTTDNSGVVIGGDIFIPDELISGWLNMPDGTVKAVGNGIGRAAQNGLFQVGYSLYNLPAGSYSIVLYGQRSEVQGVGNFTVTNPVTQSLNYATSLPSNKPHITFEGASK